MSDKKIVRMKRNEAQELMETLLTNEDSAILDSVTLDSTAYQEFSENLYSLQGGDNKDENAIETQKQKNMQLINTAILDGINDYKKEHGTTPDASVIASAVDYAQTILDSAINGESSTKTNAEHFTIMDPIVGIRSFIATAIPFGAIIPADKTSGEGSIVIVSHLAGKETGEYKEGGSLNGLSGGKTYISTERTHTLETSDQLSYTGKITTIQTDSETCDPSGQVTDLVRHSTQVYINGLLVIDGTTGAGDDESATGYITLQEKHLITAQVNIKKGTVTVTAQPALPENTEVMAVGYLDTESSKFDPPSVKIDGKSYKFKAKWWCTDVTVTKEAETQFKNEVGISPLFEGILAIKKQHQAEILLTFLDRLTKIGSKVNHRKFDFDWSGQGLNKESTSIAKELLNSISEASKDMANKNGSHGVSHIYVGNKLASILSNLGANDFEPSGLKPVASVYRLGRLKGLGIDVYYTPKGIPTAKEEAKTERMLLIGANMQDVSKNPVILGEATAPITSPLGETRTENTSGYRVRGQSIKALNPVPEYQQSAAVIDCVNMPS